MCYDMYFLLIINIFVYYYVNYFFVNIICGFFLDVFKYKFVKEKGYVFVFFFFVIF